MPQAEWRTDLDRRANPFSVGPACVWSLVVVPGHWLVQGLQPFGLPWPADGYSLPYQLLVAAASLSAAVVGLGFLFAICRRFARPVPAALATALMTLGTTLVYYNAVEISMAHGLGAAALAALVWYWLKTYGSARPVRWLLVGVLLGAAALMRWQLTAAAVLPAGEALLTAWRAREAGLRRIGGGPLLQLGLAAVGAAAAFSPQMVAWRWVFGHWLTSPMPLAHNWLQPSLWEVLGSSNRSLFYWTPLSLAACVGFLAWRRPARTVPAPWRPPRGVGPRRASGDALRRFRPAGVRARQHPG